MLENVRDIFCDFRIFEQARVAKHSQKLLRNSNSLLCKMPKENYFRNGNFM